jgi:glycerol-3-phosphate dehydrogenase
MMADVESNWAGLRPLIHEEGKSASELSRKDEIFESKTGLISIAGGKLTGYRKMAERVVDLVIKRKFEERNLQPCQTESLLLAGGKLHSVSDVRNYLQQISTSVDLFGLKGDDANYLVHLYGQQASDILEYALQNSKTDRDIDLALAELWFALNHEMIVKAADFFVRRTGLLYFDLPKLMKIKTPVLEAMAAHFSWSEEELQKESRSIDLLIEQTCHFKSN